MAEMDKPECIALQGLIDRCLASFLYDSARFYCERLYYESPCCESLYTLAQCYFRQGKTKQTYLILQDSCTSINQNSNSEASKNARYLFAIACVALEKLDEAERALQPHFYQTSHSMTAETMRETPGRAAGVYLLGKICRSQNRKEQSIGYYKISLEVRAYLTYA
jgi:tetratricopeptide (TPR) repeat protein